MNPSAADHAARNAKLPVAQLAVEVPAPVVELVAAVLVEAVAEAVVGAASVAAVVGAALSSSSRQPAPIAVNRLKCLSNRQKADQFIAATVLLLIAAIADSGLQSAPISLFTDLV
jgi:hypothetical protein